LPLDIEVDRTVATPTRFTVTTVRCDCSRASLQVVGDLNVDAATILGTVADTHIRTQRRYLRVDLSEVESLNTAALSLLSDIHRRVLACQGTLIFTGVSASLEKTMAKAPAELLLLAPTAAEQLD
jgi:anti-anti-sigma regulatory factor